MTPCDRAYVLAGYSDTPWARYNTSKLAHVPEVAARIEELMDQFSDHSGIAEYLQRKLSYILLVRRDWTWTGRSGAREAVD